MDEQPTACVVMAAKGYQEPTQGEVITGLDEAGRCRHYVFHAGPL